jgi:alkylation response protein AidB-like acyl-CoA dehydrogenase
LNHNWSPTAAVDPRGNVMDFEVSEEQAMLREVSRSMLAAVCSPEYVRSFLGAGEGGDEKLWQRGVELGWTSLAVPEEMDGAGQGLVELALIAEEIGRAAAPGPWVTTALAAAAAARGGAPADVVGDLADGFRKAAIVDASVPGMVHAAGSADWLLVVSRDSVGLVERSRVATRKRETLDQSRMFYAVDVDDLAPDHPLAVEPRWVLDGAAVLTAADALGVGERLLAMTVEYAKVREQFGRPIGSFQVVKHKAADMLAIVKGVRAATYYAAMALDAHTDDATSAASVAKAFAAEQVPVLAGHALQTHGGIGFTWEHDLHLFLRRATVDEVLFGDAGFHHDRVAALLA